MVELLLELEQDRRLVASAMASLACGPSSFETLRGGSISCLKRVGGS
jgi:hypothetical protein